MNKREEQKARRRVEILRVGLDLFLRKGYNATKITDIAKEGSCVIVGRSADYILKDVADTINVFVYGEKEEKLKRISELKNIDERKALKLMEETDKKRSINYKYYTDNIWGDRKNYMLMLNSTKIGIEKSVDIIASLY